MTIAIAVTGTVAVAVYSFLAGLQILVLNPLAAAPGKDLDQIREDMAAANESLGAPFVVGFLGLGVALAIFVLVLVLARRDMAPLTAAFLYLVVLMLGAPAYFVASFHTGMGLADTYMIRGGDHSPWALPLYATSALAVIGAGIVGAVDLTRRHRRIIPPLQA